MRKVHYHLLDVLKLFVLFSIQTLHVYEFIFYKDDVFLDGLSSVYIYTQYFARVFSLGGQILVAIIFFFFGLNSKTRLGLLKIAAFALFGQFVIACAFVEEGGVLQSLEWDIYAFIALTNVILALLPEKKRHLLWLSFFSFLILWVPPAFWQGLFPQGTFFDILSGRLGPHNSGAWAPLPWFFHSLLFFALGSWFKDHRDLLRVFQKGELIIWGVLLLLCLSHFGAYFQTPIGPHYYSFNFSRSPFIYWANFLPFVFWMRVSFLDTIQGRLSKWSIFPWISQLAWTRYVGLTYVLAIIYVGIGAQFDEAFARIPYAFDLFYLSIMPVVELIARGLLSWRQKWRTLPDETSSRS
jgi:hypothetical protein